MDSYSIKAVLSVADKGFTTKMKAAANSLDAIDSGSKKASSSIAKIAAGVGTFKALAVAVDTVKESLSGAIDRFDTMNRFPKVMEQIGFSTEVSNKSVKRLSEGVQGLPTSLNEIAASTQNIAVLTGSLNKATNTALALNNAFLASGAATYDAERGLVQYTQMLSKGKVDLESWRTLQETMGMALNEVAKAFGFAGSAAQNELYSALQSGKITFDQFNDKLIELDGGVNGFAERAKVASGGIQTSMTNMRIAVVRGVEQTIRSIDDSLKESDLPGFQQQLEIITDGINNFFSIAADSAGEFVSVAAPGIQSVNENLDVLLPTLGATAAAMVGMKAAFAIEQKVRAYNTAMETAKKRLEAMKAATELSTRATKLHEKAIIITSAAEKLNADAMKKSGKAAKAKKAADLLAADAAKAKAKAVKSSVNVEKFSEQAERKSVAATRARVNASSLAADAAKAKERAIKGETIASKACAKATAAETAATTAGATASEISSVAIAVKTAALGVLSGQLGVVAAAQMVWNTAMRLNPIGTVITAVSALTAFLVGLVKLLSKVSGNTETFEAKQEKLRDTTDELTESIKKNQKAYKRNNNEIEESTENSKELLEKVIELAKKEEKSADEKLLLQSRIDALNKAMDGLNLQYDKEADALGMTVDQLRKKAAAYEAQQKYENQQERYTKNRQEQVEVEKDLAQAVKDLGEVQSTYNKLKESGSMLAETYNAKLSDQKKICEDLEAQKQSLETEEKELETAMVESQNIMASATEESTTRQKLSFKELMNEKDRLSENQRETVERITSSYGTMTERLSSLNQEIEEDSETTWSKVQQNQQDVLAKTQEFATLYAQLIDAGVSESYLNALGATGPEALPLLRGMMEGGIEEVLSSQAQWQAAYDTIGHTFTDSLEMGDEERAAIQEYILGESGVFGTLQQAIDEADFSNLLKAVPEGIAEGISENAGLAEDATTTMVEGVKGAATGGLDIHSPSGVFREYGENTIDGFILGIQNRQGVLNTTMRQVVNNSGKSANEALRTSMQGMELASIRSFSKITLAVRSGMSDITKEISNGTEKSDTAMELGMKSMSNTVQQNMGIMKTQTSSGMKTFSRMISDGMIRSKNSVTQGSLEMKLQTAGLKSSFYNSGYQASIGLANGINTGSRTAIAAANRLANSVAATMNHALKIHSPSRITREIGGYTTEGFVLGLLEDIHKVKNAAYEMAAAAVPRGMIEQRVAYAGGYTMHADCEYKGTISGATYTIVVPVELDGRETARVIAPYTQEELERMETRDNRRHGKR